MRNIAIVSGASSGIGKEFAIKISKNFDIDEIWLIARRKNKLLELGKKIYSQYGINVVVLSLDLLDFNSIFKIQDRLKKYRPNIKILVNSSGFGLMGKSFDIDTKIQENMIELNCKALFSLTNTCIEYMSSGSNIVQISSSAGFCPQAYFSVYSATKAFVLSYSISLANELEDKNISVNVVCPGPVDTEFFEFCEKNAKMNNKIKKMFMQDVSVVVNRSIKSIKKNKNIIIPSLSMKIVAILNGIHLQLLSSKLSKFIYKKYNY